jgi:6-pyruvoyltetrahydropterin/6-carboxytetrahydropterin synthase
MFSLRIERTFSAAHAIVLGGEREALHGHDWRVRMTVEGDQLDGDGLLCDFHLLERVLDSAIAPLRDSNLNDVAVLAGINPTAENVALYLASTVAGDLPPAIRRLRLAITEAPGCEAAVTQELTT